MQNYKQGNIAANTNETLQASQPTQLRLSDLETTELHISDLSSLQFTGLENLWSCQGSVLITVVCLFVGDNSRVSVCTV